MSNMQIYKDLIEIVEILGNFVYRGCIGVFLALKITLCRQKINLFFSTEMVLADNF